LSRLKRGRIDPRDRFKVVGCPHCKSIRITEGKRPLCFYCGKRMTNLYASFPTAEEARAYIQKLKEAELEDWR